MKALIEKKNSLIDEMESLLNKAKTEVRAFTDEEDTRIEEIKNEVRGLEKLIADAEEVRKFDKGKKKKAEEGEKEMDKDLEVRTLDVQNSEIRKAIEDEKELNISDFEVEERKIGIGQTDTNIASSVGNIKKTTFANAILKKAFETSDLLRYVRKENLGSALHQIPVQKTKVGKFVNVKELATYAEKNVDYTPIQLAPHKFGNITVISEEAIADTGYNLMADLLEQYGEGAAETIDEVLVKGDDTLGIQGLESFINSTGQAQDNSIKVDITSAGVGKIGINDMLKIYNALPQKYRKNATWVIGTELAGKLTEAVDSIGRPLLYTDFSQVPFGGKATPMLLGRPVVISDHVKNLTDAKQHNSLAFFGDLSKALIFAPRQSFTIKTSTEYEFIRDGITVKGTMRFDVKRALGEAIAVLVRSN